MDAGAIEVGATACVPLVGSTAMTLKSGGSAPFVVPVWTSPTAYTSPFGASTGLLVMPRGQMSPQPFTLASELLCVCDSGVPRLTGPQAI